MMNEKPTYIVMSRGFGKKFRMMAEFIERIRHGMKIKIINADKKVMVLETIEDVYEWMEGNKSEE